MLQAPAQKPSSYLLLPCHKPHLTHKHCQSLMHPHEQRLSRRLQCALGLSGYVSGFLQAPTPNTCLYLLSPLPYTSPGTHARGAPDAPYAARTLIKTQSSPRVIGQDGSRADASGSLPGAAAAGEAPAACCSGVASSASISSAMCSSTERLNRLPWPYRCAHRNYVFRT